MIQRLCILGVGLIGGSLARAVRQAGTVGEVVGWGRRAERLQHALTLGVLDHGEQDLTAAVKGADMVVVATPLAAMPEVFRELSGVVEDTAVITDVGSVKGTVVNMARETLGPHMTRFVPGHPIAGLEQAGVEVSRADLFERHCVILTPVAETDNAAVGQVRGVWESAGAHVVEMDVAHHDEVLAATSHLPHALAYALVDCLAQRDESEEVFRYAAGGFRDFTRIASSDPVMWRDICLANKERLLEVLQDFDAHLHHMMEAIQNDDSEGLLQVFTRAKTARDRIVNRDKGKVTRAKGKG